MTTPRDAIGLSDRLREEHTRILDLWEERREAATQLDALQAKVKELEAKAAALFWSIPDDIAAQIKCGDLQKRAAELLDAESRATSAEQERDKALACCDSYANENQQLHDRMEKAQQERDEAYELAAKVALAHVSEPGLSDNPAYIHFEPSDMMARKIAAAIRRLAAGTEKEEPNG